jgi:hypothetical protein
LAADQECLIDRALGAVAAKRREHLVLSHVVDALQVGRNNDGFFTPSTRSSAIGR